MKEDRMVIAKYAVVELENRLRRQPLCPSGTRCTGI